MGPLMEFGEASTLGDTPNEGLLTESGRFVTLSRHWRSTGPLEPPYLSPDSPDLPISSQTAHKAPYSPVGGFVVYRHPNR